MNIDPTAQLAFPHGERVEVGPANLYLVPATAIHELQQIRREYDPKGIEELAWSIILDADLLSKSVEAGDYNGISSALDLSHPLILNRLDNENLDSYIHDHARYYQIEPENIIPDGDSTLVRISGHRRHRALEMIAKWYGFGMERLHVQSTIHDNLSFDEALHKQYTENISERPPVTDEARAISSYYRFLEAKTGTKPTLKMIASHFGCSEAKVSSAIAFTSLPAEIRAYADEVEGVTALPYSVLSRFRPLADAYERQYAIKSEGAEQQETKEQYVVNNLAIMANKLAQMKLERKSAQRIHEVLTAQIKMIQGENSFETDQLFILADGSGERRERSANALVERALAVLALIGGQQKLSPAHLAQIQALTGQAVELAQPSVQTEPLF